MKKLNKVAMLFASAAKVTFSLTGRAGAAGRAAGAAGRAAGAGVAGEAGLAGRAAGAGAGAAGRAAGAAGFTAPSQLSAAVAGVQNGLRQHSSLVPFFHTSDPSPLRQLSTVLAWAKAAIGAARAAAATSITTLFSFFMVLLSMKAAARLRNVRTRRETKPGKPRRRSWPPLSHPRPGIVP